jgi:hypothetical protein
MPTPKASVGSPLKDILGRVTVIPVLILNNHEEFELRHEDGRVLGKIGFNPQLGPYITPIVEEVEEPDELLEDLDDGEITVDMLMRAVATKPLSPEEAAQNARPV